MSEHSLRVADGEAETEILAPSSSDDAPATLWDTLAAKIAEAPTGEYLDIVVPGFDGLLALRTVAISPQMQARLNDRHTKSKSPERDTWLAADLLIAATREVVGRTTIDEEYGVLSDDDGEPVRIDERLAAKLRFPADATKARQVLLLLFGGAPSPEFAIRAAANDYGEWASSGIDIEALAGK